MGYEQNSKKNVQNKKTADVQISGHKKLHILKCSFALVANDVIIFFTLKCELYYHFGNPPKQ